MTLSRIQDPPNENATAAQLRWLAYREGASRLQRTAIGAGRVDDLLCQEADEQGADDTADGVDSDDVEGVIESGLPLNVDSVAANDTGSQTDADGGEGSDEAGGRGDGDESGDGAEAAPIEVTLRPLSMSTMAQPSIAAPVAVLVAQESGGCEAAGAQGATGVEAEPAEPEHAGAEHGERDIVGGSWPLS